MASPESMEIFQRMQETSVNFMGNIDENLVWFNATQEDVADPSRYIEWRVNDRLAQGPIYDQEWHPYLPLHTGETLYVAQVNDPTHGFEHELFFSTDPNDSTLSLHTVRFGLVEPGVSVVYEIHMPWIGTMDEDAMSYAYRRAVSDQDRELQQHLESTLLLYSKRRENLHRFNMPRIGFIPPAGLIALAATIKLVHQSGISRIHMPHTLPVRHSMYTEEEAYLFHDQALKLFEKAATSIDGASLSPGLDNYGYLTINLDPIITSRHKLLTSLFM